MFLLFAFTTVIFFAHSTDMNDYDVAGLQNEGPFDGEISAFNLKFNIHKDLKQFPNNNTYCNDTSDCTICYYYTNASLCGGETPNDIFTPSPSSDGYTVESSIRLITSSIRVLCSNETSIVAKFGTLPFIEIQFSTPFGCPKKKVALVGDRTYYAYPAFLAALAGSNYEITDYSVGLTTAMTSSHINPEFESYRDTAEYSSVLQTQWDYLVVLLGTNDGHPSNFPVDSPETFLEDYKTLIAAFVKSHPKGQVVVCTTPFSNESDLDRNFREKMEEYYIRPMQEIIVHEFGLQVVDLGSLTQSYSGFLSSDGLHPSPEGAEFMAQEIFKTIDNGHRSRRRKER